ncbi:arginase family protein [Aminipila butyrica]|uniref:arginase family protein n=1 Tax=Aminipila butyrica TaxID=433296 RepID=UPI001A9BD84B|nr:arginase family protein [Aminipila butyrica]
MNPYEKKHLNLFIPQWQSGGQEMSTYEGGLEIINHYLPDCELSTVDVSTQPISQQKNNILGYDDIMNQLRQAKEQISQHQPKTIFTIGGGCDSDMASISYLNQLTQGDMTLLYFDSHGDLHTPESSDSKYFYGMPLRTLQGQGDEKMVHTLFSSLDPSQVMLLGARDLDEAEKQYIKDAPITALTVADMERSTEKVLSMVREKNHRYIYVHIDLDVLDPGEFPYVPVPAANGLKIRNFLEILKRLNQEFHLIGLGLLEYNVSGGKEDEVIKEIVRLGCGMDTKKRNHLNLLYPQWQGGGANKATYEGALDLKKDYLDMEQFVEIPVDLQEDLSIENNIWGYHTIYKQLHTVKAMLDTEEPHTLFTVGGGDDVEVLPLSYMNYTSQGDLAVLFFDAHGDLNTPESSPSKNFHGMPLRTLLGDTHETILDLMYSTLTPAQVVMVGTRDCDPVEEQYIAENQLRVITAPTANRQPEAVLSALKEKGKKKLYIHIDIDVIDPLEFPYQPVPAAGGLHTETLSKLLKLCSEEFEVVGLCMLGYTALGQKKIAILEEIIQLGMSI